jgi:glycine/sarcosine N-methyltransferase
MLQNAQINAQERGLSLKLVQSDFRMIDQVVHETFDCVMATGNSLAHVTPDDVKQALLSMTQLVKTGGYLYFDTRNWDKITREKQRFFCYNPFFKGEDRINLVQVWDYVSTSEIVFNLLHTFEREGKIYKKEETSVCYYPIFKDQLLTFLGELGYDDIELFDFMRPQNMDFDEMNWYALCARKR